MEAKLDKCLFKGTVKGVFRLFIAVQQTTLKLASSNKSFYLSHCYRSGWAGLWNPPQITKLVNGKVEIQTYTAWFQKLSV